MSDSVVQVNELSRQFGSFVAVDKVSFSVARGSIFGLLGPNGSGKSTIIRMLLGILPPTSGSATVLGLNVRQHAEQIKPRVGYMSQQFSLYGDLSVRENLDFYGRIYGQGFDRLNHRRHEVIELTGISNRLPQLARTLSGGWKQRLALACALIHEPDVIFLDEPTAGIDPVARRQLWDLLFELSGRGVTLLVTTHYMDEAERCTNVGYLYQSRLLVSGVPETLKQLASVTPAGTTRFDLKLPFPTRHLSRLRAIEGVHDATLFGDRVHLLADVNIDRRLFFPESESTVDEPEVRAVQPTLEDVFVTLTALADRKEFVELPDLPHPKDSAEPAHESSQSEETGAPKFDSPSPIQTRGRWGMAGLWAVFVKEFVHIRRQPTTLFFMFIVPVIQTIIFGYAINTQIENIRTVYLDLDGRVQSQKLIEQFQNTRRFKFVERVHSEEQLDRSLRSGRAKVGVIIPPNFSERLMRGEQVQIQVLIDGSDSQVASTAQNTSQLLGQSISIRMAQRLGESLQLTPGRNSEGEAVLPMEVRARLLYNPDLESSRFFVPGLIGVILQLVTLFLTSFAIVREREMGTLEQLFVTPVGRVGLLLGKLIPYSIVGIVEVLIMLVVMECVFGVPIRGNVSLLIALSLLFTVCSLGLGLFISTISKSQLEAFQFAFIVMLPSILLSGFVFPREEMPLPIYWISFALPATWFIEILRGIILRGADAVDLMPSIIALSVCCAVVLVASVMRFEKRLA